MSLPKAELLSSGVVLQLETNMLRMIVCDTADFGNQMYYTIDPESGRVTSHSYSSIERLIESYCITFNNAVILGRFSRSKQAFTTYIETEKITMSKRAIRV